MLLIIDFDGVLFDDRAFKRDYQTLFKSFGISSELYARAYTALKENIGYYDPHKHLREIKKSHPTIDLESIKEAIGKFILTSRRYVYPDSKKILTDIQQTKTEIVLLSTGPEFQKKKVDASGLSSLFDRVVIIREPFKSKAVKRILRAHDSARVLFIDDKREVVEEVKRALPNITVVQMARANDQDKSQLVDYVAENLTEIYSKFFR